MALGGGVLVCKGSVDKVGTNLAQGWPGEPWIGLLANNWIGTKNMGLPQMHENLFLFMIGGYLAMKSYVMKLLYRRG